MRRALAEKERNARPAAIAESNAAAVDRTVTEEIRRLARAAATRCRTAIHDAPPAGFAPVMATGIVSRAAGLLGSDRLSGVLFALAAAVYAVWAGALLLRLVGRRGRPAGKPADPARVFGFFTFVAASDVLATRLTGRPWAAPALVALALPAWLLVSGRVVVTLRRAGPQAASRRADGTWFLVVVGLQSLVLAAAGLSGTGLAHRGELVGWLVGLTLYGLVTAVVGRRLLRYGVAPRELTPVYWVSMGAGAISVLAGCQVLPYDGPVLRGVSVVLLDLVWGWATLLLPVLVAAGLWRHGRHRVPLRPEPVWWTAVFPIGMYAVATAALGAAEHRTALASLGRAVAVCALVAWALTATGVFLRPFLSAGTRDNQDPIFFPGHRPGKGRLSQSTRKDRPCRYQTTERCEGSRRAPE
ncbi:tellurite resistance/C4-dicarboxylate transporter family protein [Streptomyces sp. NPDC006012]|uniref:tellurite resistance/C4-dicarboxylate transporter family protein n=1 Tax=Streptomyces sp. NPDC006012 TaxID=3364739 RepID=UPI0036794F7C